MTGKKTSPGLFRETPPPMTPYEKTAAVAKGIIETEAQKRADLTASLREARLARNADKGVSISGAKKVRRHRPGSL